MNKSFTLIEILVVIVIIGILSAFIIVSMAGVSDKATIAKGQAFGNSLRNSLLMDLVAEWKLNETGIDTTAKDSWSTNNATLTDFVFTDPNSGWRTGSQCVSGGCLSFDGTNDDIHITDADNLKSDNITVEIWIKPNSILNKGAPIRTTITNRYYMAMHDMGTPALTWHVRKSDNTGSYLYSYSVSQTNKWYHVVGTHQSASFQRFYVNGKKEADLNLTWGPVAAAGYDWRIGTTDWQASSAWYNGLIDEVRIYKTAMSTTKIQQNYYVGLNKLFKNDGIMLNEFNERIAELKLNLANNN
ncbi:MAG: LamG domain-containing protein [Candidatus Paceibacterota bacterium]|jgi:prepilin-type N-terminal cleavage/methylation domain-containing protein